MGPLRIRPCPCGSGRAARDCCGRFRRLSDADVARAYLHRQARAGRELLAPFSPGGLAGLRRELGALPAAHDLLVIALHGPATPEVVRLAFAARRHADADGDATRFVRVMQHRCDTPLARGALAKAVVALREGGSVDEHLAAAALVDLDAPESELFAAAMLAAVSVDMASSAAATGRGRSGRSGSGDRGGSGRGRPHDTGSIAHA